MKRGRLWIVTQRKVDSFSFRVSVTHRVYDYNPGKGALEIGDELREVEIVKYSVLEDTSKTLVQK